MVKTLFLVLVRLNRRFPLLSHLGCCIMCFFSHNALPEPVTLEEKIHFLDRDLLCFWQEEVDEAAHDENQGGKEQEDSELEVTERD